jgi:hypothetical protein
VQGQNNVSLYCVDNVGRWNYDTETFFIDSINPVVTIISPANASYNATDIDFNYTASDANLDGCVYSINGTENITATNATLTFTEGQHNITLYCNDSLANWGSDFVSFYVDSIAPQINLTSPTNTTYTTTNVWVNLTLNEPGYCWYSLNGGLNISMSNTSGNFNKRIFCADGEQCVTAYCRDAYYNWNSSTVCFTIAEECSLCSIRDAINNLTLLISTPVLNVWNEVTGWFTGGDGVVHKASEPMSTEDETLADRLEKTTKDADEGTQFGWLDGVFAWFGEWVEHETKTTDK